MGCTANTSGCIDQYNCVEGSCPDFLIKRNDNKPDFKVKVDDCNGPMDLIDLVLEASMWANGRLKVAVSSVDDYISLADNIGFNQVMVGDIIIVNRPRQTEHMLVIAFDEVNYYIRVQRGHHNTIAQNFKKGQELKIVKFMNVSSTTEMILQDIININGTTTKDVLTESFLVYNWQPSDTCLPGCYTLEFKLMKMSTEFTLSGQSITPSFIDPSLVNYHCGLSANVEWVRRFPANSEGYKIKIYDSPTTEM